MALERPLIELPLSDVAATHSQSAQHGLETWNERVIHKCRSAPFCSLFDRRGIVWREAREGGRMGVQG